MVQVFKAKRLRVKRKGTRFKVQGLRLKVGVQG